VDEKSKLYPLSEYAKSKITAEKKILELSNSSFCTTVLRLSTLYGLSEKRMRFDLIVNLMTLHAWKNKKIFILGGGKQWRPLIHIDDCINAFYIVLDAQKKIINKQIFNVGSNDQNYQVFQVANILKRFFPEIDIEIAPDDPDQRSYRVNFDKFTRALYFKPKKTIEDGVREIKEALEKGKITDDLRTNTLWYYKHLIESNDLLSKIKIRGKLF
jgi:nucleoside-diphosphate-sugar epimerase